MTLHKLIDRGFVTFVKEGRRNFYQAANPKHIINFIEEKKTRFEEILPELLAKQEQATEKPEIVTYRGIKGVKELLLELLEAGGTEHNTFGSSNESLMLGESWWVNYHKKRSERGIKARLLFNKSIEYWDAESKYPDSEVRYTKSGFEPLTETIIRNKMIGVIIWSEKPLGVIINQELAAKSYNQFFSLLWDGGSD